MNQIVNKVLLTRNKCMPEMHWIQLVFTFSDCRSFTKDKGRKQKFKETGDSRYIYQSELCKACFYHDMAYGYFKELSRRTTSHKALRDKYFNIAKNSKYDEHQRWLASLLYKFFDKKCATTQANKSVTHTEKGTNSELQQLAEELHKPIIRKFKK